MAMRPARFRPAARARQVRVRVGTQRVRGNGFYRLKGQQLMREPLCRVCASEGIVTSASQADHIVPLADGGAEGLGPNLQSLCKDCHDRKTAAENAARAKGRGEGESLPPARRETAP